MLYQREQMLWADLGHQMKDIPDPDAALDAVREGWAQELGWV